MFPLEAQALLVGGQVIVGRSKGVQRQPLAPLIPTQNENRYLLTAVRT